MRPGEPGDGMPMEAATQLVAEALAQLVEAAARAALERLPEASEASGRERSPWMSLDSAASYLDWPAQRLYKLTASGDIPHYKQDGRLLFRRDELDAWLSRFAEGGRAM